MDTAKVIIEVTAGIILGQPMDEYTKKIVITSSQWDQPEEVMKAYGFAQEYMRTLWNPMNINWVTANWIYL